MSADPYEAVAYPGFPFAQTHPDRLFTVAVLHGVDAAPPAECRLLELGCGDGVNVVAMAAGLPGMRALGIDRAASPLERGRALAAAAGAGNVELRALDLLAARAEDLGEFDYVVAHGVLSWVPEPVRAALLALTAGVLAPSGVAFVSYNALPGGYVRRAARDLLRLHAGDEADPERRVARAQEAIALAQGFGARTDPYGIAFGHEIERLSRLAANSLLHDDLSDVWEPMALRHVAARAAEHGLAYLGDADLSELRLDRFPPGVDDALHRIAGDDVVLREQYGDLLAGRPFRQSLFVRADAAPSPQPVAAGVERLRLRVEVAPDPLPGGGHASPLDAALDRIAARFPATVAAADVPDVSSADLLAAFRLGRLELHARAPEWAVTLPERPAATPLARAMAATGTHVVTLDHGAYLADDPIARRLLTLMDGSRSPAQLVDGLVASVGRELVVEGDATPEELRSALAARAEEDLAAFLEARLIRQDAP